MTAAQRGRRGPLSGQGNRLIRAITPSRFSSQCRIAPPICRMTQPENDPAYQPVEVEQRFAQRLVLADQSRQRPAKELHRVTARRRGEPAKHGHDQERQIQQAVDRAAGHALESSQRRPIRRGAHNQPDPKPQEHQGQDDDPKGLVVGVQGIRHLAPEGGLGPVEPQEPQGHADSQHHRKRECDQRVQPLMRAVTRGFRRITACCQRKGPIPMRPGDLDALRAWFAPRPEGMDHLALLQQVPASCHPRARQRFHRPCRPLG